MTVVNNQKQDVIAYLTPGSKESGVINQFVKQIERMIQCSVSGGYQVTENDQQFSDDFNALLEIARNLKTTFIPYSEITRIMYDQKSTDGIDVLTTKLRREICKNIEQRSDGEVIATDIIVLIKVSEHIKLASKQIDSLYNKQDSELKKQQERLATLESNISASQEKLIENQTVLKDNEKKLKSNEKKIKKLNNLKSSVYGDFISILGIFSALIFALFGGFHVVSNVLVQVSKSIRFYRIMIATSLLGIVLLGLIFFLLKAVALMSGKTIASKKEGNVFLKYPFFMWSLIALVVLFIGATLIDINDHYHVIQWMLSR